MDIVVRCSTSQSKWKEGLKWGLGKWVRKLLSLNLFSSRYPQNARMLHLAHTYSWPRLEQKRKSIYVSLLTRFPLALTLAKVPWGCGWIWNGQLAGCWIWNKQRWSLMPRLPRWRLPVEARHTLKGEQSSKYGTILTLKPTYGGFSHSTSWVSYNSTQFWPYLSGDSIRSHRLRAPSHKMHAPLQRAISNPDNHLCFWWTSYRSEVPTTPSWV